MTRLDAVALDRGAGALLGLAAGDALGAGYEFVTPGPAHAEMIGGGGFGWKPGEWTDDTQMAICIAEEAATGEVDAVRVGQRFLDWYGTRPPDVGIQTATVLGAARSPDELATRSAEHFARNPRNAAGNGSLMRTAPVALAGLHDSQLLRRLATEVSSLTHGDPLAAEACVIWSTATAHAVRHGTFDGVTSGVDALTDEDRRSYWRDVIEAAEHNEPETFTGNGFVVRALQAAWSSIVYTPVPAGEPWRHLPDALRRAVGIGDDTDTVAAIAGMLLGARWGASAIPFTWRRLLHGWPGYRARDLVHLAVLSATRGAGDRHGWPAAASMAPTYGTEGSHRSTLVELPGDDGVLIGDFAALPAAVNEVDAVVSLCRTGTEDVPPGLEHHEVWLVDVADPAANPNLHLLLRDSAEAVATLRDEGKRVLLHCVHAQSRTPTVAAAYLAERNRLSGKEALEQVIAALPAARPNRHFVATLQEMWP
jgi:ADP-ribosyl-[dinitrogen reductase] hydrolase